jgi:2-oxoglutarate ferredoxin oxidoreductase subunit gamma
LLDGKISIHTQSYGSASRGGLTKSDVRIEEGEIYDLVCDELDVLVALSQQSYDRYSPALRRGGWLFYESDMVQIQAEQDAQSHGAGVTDIAYKTFGRKIMANMIMIGFANEIARIVSRESLARTIGESVPPGTEEKNIAAFTEGMRLGAAAVAGAG